MWMQWNKMKLLSREPQMLELHWINGGQRKNLLGQAMENLALYPSCDEYWNRFPSVAVGIVQALFADLDVLTAVHAFSPQAKIKRKYNKKYNMYSSEQMFLRSYFETLYFHGLADNIKYCKPEELISQTKGADIPLSKMLFPAEYGVLSYETYGYTSLPVMETFQQMKEQLKNTSILYLDYGRYPDEINLTIDTKRFPMACCISRIQNVCQSLDVPLKIDPTLKV